MSLLPRRRRRRAWAALGRRLGWSLPSLERVSALETGIPMLVIVVPLTALFAAQTDLLASSTAWVLALAIPLAGLLWMLTTPLAVQLPAGCSVGDAAESVLRYNLGQVYHTRGVWDDREIWEGVRTIVAEQLGADRERLRSETHLVDDLGMDR